MPPTAPLIVALLLRKVPLPALGEALLLLKVVSNPSPRLSTARSGSIIKVPFAAFEAFKKIVLPRPSAATESVKSARGLLPFTRKPRHIRTGVNFRE